MNEDCIFKGFIIKGIEVHSNYLVYLYLVFESEYFKTSYLLSPVTENFLLSL